MFDLRLNPVIRDEIEQRVQEIIYDDEQPFKIRDITDLIEELLVRCHSLSK